jgi:hypothetical protein
MHLKPQNCSEIPMVLITGQHQKILIRGTQIINSAMVPIGQMSEEARNKDMKRFREHHTR